MKPDVILWVYIVLLVVGGLIGFLKAGSKVSLIMSVAFAALLSLCAAHIISPTRTAETLADIILAALLLVFGLRLVKTKKFMPAGLMLVLTVAALLFRHVS